MRSFKVRMTLVTEGADGKPARQVNDLGSISPAVDSWSAFCRRNGLAHVRDATAPGGGYGVDLQTGATALAVGWPAPADLRAAAGTVADDPAEEALWQETFRQADLVTAARQAEVAAMVRRAPAEEVATLRRARRQAQALSWRTPRERAAAGLARAGADLEAAEAELADLEAKAAEAEAARESASERARNLGEKAEGYPAARAEEMRLVDLAKALREDVERAAEVAAAARRRLRGVKDGQTAKVRERLAAEEAARRAAEAWEVRREAVLFRRSLGWEGRAALAQEEAAEEVVDLEEVA